MQDLIGALDIGGTKIAATIADASGPLVRLKAPTIKSGSADALALQVLDLLRQALQQAGGDTADTSGLPLGVSSCGPFVQVDGQLCLAAPNICGGLARRGDLPNDWTVLPLQRILEPQFARVVIRNDCVAALLGERTFGAVVGQQNCVYVTWSTGIGFGLCVDGNLLAGKQGNAGHAGHLLMDPYGSTRCGCGNLGDLESLISGINISQGQALATPALFAAARDGDADALARVAPAAAWLGRALYNLVVTLDTHVFVIGGSVWQHHGHWLAPLVLHEIESRFPVLTNGVSILAAGLDSYVADIGACCLVMPSDWIADWRLRRPWQRLDHMPG